MKATKFTYLVFAQIKDDFGFQVVGIGSHPLYILQNEKSNEIQALLGDDLSKLQIYSNNEGYLSEVIANYIDEVGLADFNSSTEMEIDKNYLTELIMAAFNKDTSDFEFENQISTLLLEGIEEVSNESILEKHPNKFGIWLLEKDDCDINFNPKSKSLRINGVAYKNLGETFDFLLNESSQVALFID